MKSLLGPKSSLQKLRSKMVSQTEMHPSTVGSTNEILDVEWPQQPTTK